jgi:hypothetical protein
MKLSDVRFCEIFDGLIKRRWGTSINPPIPTPTRDDSEDMMFEEYYDDDEAKRTVPDIEDTVDANGRLLDQQPAYTTGCCNLRCPSSWEKV